MPEVYVGVGSNIEPEHELGHAAAALVAAFGPLQCSDVFASAAYGFSGPDFLNMVVGFSTELGPDGVEAHLSSIEDGAARRPRRDRFASRELDLDLLLYGQMVDASRRLPRDDLRRYPFVLKPLAELAPALRHPLTGRPFVREWAELAARDRPELRRVGTVDTLRGPTSPRSARRLPRESDR